MRTFFRILWRIITAPFRFIDWIVRSIYRIKTAVFGALKTFFIDEPEDVPLGDAVQLAVENPSEILYHIDALRMHLMRAAASFIIACIVIFIFIDPILAWMTAPIPGGRAALVAIDVTEPLSVVMRVVMLAGFTVSLPYIILELLLFAAPGLSRRARLLGLLAIPLVTTFFVGGLLFSYYFMLPPALEFLINFKGFATEPRPSSYVTLITGIMFWIGLAFEFPLVIFVLASMGVVRAEWLKDNWRIALVLITILAAVITPTVDPLNMGLVMVPLTMLYILSIGLAYIGQGRRKAHNKAEA
ncbi:MAG: twin-arginine translocase subunit TatC [Anaerolineales bacterium]|nr:twin-arginine translocase subunit TatC [Anaerolineales bacterium]